MPKRDFNNELWVNWSKKEKDLMVHYPNSCDGWLIHNYILSDRLKLVLKDGKLDYEIINSLIKELDMRGYDITTLKFSIKKKMENRG